MRWLHCAYRVWGRHSSGASMHTRVDPRGLRGHAAESQGRPSRTAEPTISGTYSGYYDNGVRS